MTAVINVLAAVVVCAMVLDHAGAYRLLIIHANDLHSRFNETDKFSGLCTASKKAEGKCYGGFARVSEAVTLAKRKSEVENTHALFLIAGDIYQGTLLYTFYKWKIVAAMTNLIHPDAMSLGNHEFDDGVQGLIPFINNVSFPVLAANLDLRKVPQLKVPNLKNSVVFTSPDGVKVAVIGYVTPDTKFVSQAGEVEFLNEVDSIKAEVDKLKLAHPDLRVFIALGHSGFAMDKKIAEQVPDIDAVIGGHTNTFLYTGKSPDSDDIPEDLYPKMVTQKSGRKVPVVQAYAYTKYLGQLTLDFNSVGEVTKATGNPILLDKTVNQDPFVLLELNKWARNVSEFSNQAIGETKVLLDGDSTHCRLKECNLGNFLTDAYVDYMARLYRLNRGVGWTDTPIALQHSGGIRSSIDVSGKDGKVTMADLLSVLPFVNNMVRMSLKGSDLLEVLEFSVHNYNPSERNGKFLQYSGLKVQYDLRNPNGKRVIKAYARCGECRVPVYKPIEAKETYNVIMPVFIAEGGDDYKVLKKNFRRELVMDTTDTDMARNYFEKRSPVYAGVEGRIKLIEGSSGAASKATSFLLMPLLVCFASIMSSV